MITYGITSLVLIDGNTYWYVTLNGQIPMSATRYKTENAARKNADMRKKKFS